MSLSDQKETNSILYDSIIEKQKKNIFDVEKKVYVLPYIFKNDKQDSENFDVDLYENVISNFNTSNKRKIALLNFDVSNDKNSYIFSKNNQQQCDNNKTFFEEFSTEEKSDSTQDTKFFQNDFNTPEPSPLSNNEISELGFNDIILLKQTDHLREMRTILRNK